MLWAIEESSSTSSTRMALSLLISFTLAGPGADAAILASTGLPPVRSRLTVLVDLSA
ncbi:MAG: hypothetical protein Alpg2KO_05040 [Alphaproteobacteria bacterium]